MKRGLANKILQQGYGLKKAQDHEPLGSSNVNMLIYLALFFRLQAQQKQQKQ
jgi:hypothetical protein